MSKFIILAAFAVGASLGLTTGIDTLKSARIRAKARLREALHSAEDRVSDPKVLDAVEALAIYNPTDAPAKSDALLGEWVQLNAPEFPGDRDVYRRFYDVQDEEIPARHARRPLPRRRVAHHARQPGVGRHRRARARRRRGLAPAPLRDATYRAHLG